MGNRAPKTFSIGEIEIPVDYFKLEQEERDRLCNRFIERLIVYITGNYMFKPEIDRMDVMKQVIQSSLISNNEQENYEVSGFLSDCLTKINAA